MEIIYGCDCDCSNHEIKSSNIPVAYLIKRDEKEMKVCTRCNLPSDKYIARLFDENTNPNPFVFYDTLGAIVMSKLLTEENWNLRVNG